VVQAAGEQWQVDRVISAVPWFAVAELCDEVPPALRTSSPRARPDGIVADRDREHLVRRA